MVKLIDDSENIPVIAKEFAKIDDYDPLFDEKNWVKKSKKTKDLPEHIIRNLCIMWLNSHTRASRSKIHSTETETKIAVEAWLEAHPLQNK